MRVAERRLLRTLVKDTDGFMARHVERPVSLQISRRLAQTAITPNQMSLISIVVGICGGPFFLSARPSLQTIGALLFLAHSILDGCDGELARLKFQESRWGGVLDFWGDNVVHVVIFACMALGWSRSAVAAWPLLLGAAAVLGTLGSAGFVYWRLMRLKDDGGALFTSVSATPERPLARLLDAASRRDFIYLVIILALIGKSNWFLLLAAVGAPIFFFLVVFLAVRPPASAARLAGESQPGRRRRRLTAEPRRSAGRITPLPSGCPGRRSVAASRKSVATPPNQSGWCDPSESEGGHDQRRSRDFDLMINSVADDTNLALFAVDLDRIGALVRGPGQKDAACAGGRLQGESRRVFQRPLVEAARFEPCGDAAGNAGPARDAIERMPAVIEQDAAARQRRIDPPVCDAVRAGGDRRAEFATSATGRIGRRRSRLRRSTPKS